MAQDAEQPANTFTIRKKELTFTEAASRIFQLYQRESIDTLTAEFFPDKEIALAIYDQRNIPQDEFYQLLQNDYEESKKQAILKIVESIQKAREEKVPFKTYSIKEVAIVMSSKNEIFSTATDTLRLLEAAVVCRRKNDSGSYSSQGYTFFISPLICYNGKWYLLDTRMSFMKD